MEIKMSANVSMPPSDGGLPPGLSGDRVMRGIIARWSSSTGWIDRDGLPLPATMLVIGYTTVLRRWKDKKPEYRTEHPLQDPGVLNAAIPITEWETGIDGKPREPWKLTFVVYLVHIDTGALYTYAHDTYGAMLAYTALEEQIAITRMLRGEYVFPIVHLEKRQWKSTVYGMQMRPHFQVMEWREPGKGRGDQQLPVPPVPQLFGPAVTPAPTTAPATAPAPTPTTTPPAATGPGVLDTTKPVKPVTLAELVADEVPWK
jgi:hypothetical protein